MKPFYETKLFRQFVPFMVLIIGGSFLIREFTQIRYKYNKIKSHDIREELKKKGIQLEKPATLEEEYNKTIKNIDLDNWENIRIPRPWEEPNSTQN